MALYYELQVFKDVYLLVQKVFLYQGMPALPARQARPDEGGDSGPEGISVFTWLPANFPSRLPRFARNSHGSLETKLIKAHSSAGLCEERSDEATRLHSDKTT